jgi:hypothetical protein
LTRSGIDAKGKFTSKWNRKNLLKFYISILIIYDMDLDAPFAQIGAQLHCGNGFLQRESMCDQLVEIQNASRQSADASGPGIGVSVDELQIDLRTSH